MAEAVGEISLDLLLDDSKFENSMNDVEKKTKGFGSKLGTAAKVGIAAVGAASVAAGKAVYDITKQSVESFAEYEQLVGGVETLFTDSADQVMNYANEAYKTAGLSANEYMKTVTGFSASLLQSLGGDTAKAAEVADQAIVDMADNANKMGTSMESIQNAYQGFAKQNYTMLDNLKLGYGGTQKEMQRLLEDAQAISGIEYKIENYSDVIEAIHVIQNEMGITGTTAKEAGETIQGSLDAAGSAWQNLITGMGNKDADLDKLIDNFVDSVETAAGNIIPVAEKALSGFADLLAKMVPKIAEILPELLDEIVPGILSAIESSLQTLIAALPELIQLILPPLIDITLQVIIALCEVLPDLLTTIIDVVVDAIPVLVDAIIEALPIIIEGITILVIEIAKKLPEICEALLEAIPVIIEAILEAFSPIGDGMSNIFEDVFNAIVDFFSPLINWLNDNIIQPIVEKIQFLWSIVENVLNIIEAGIILLVEAIQKIFDDIVNWISENVINPVSEFFGNLFETVWTAFMKVVDKIKEPLAKAANWVYDTLIKPVLGFFDELWNGLVNGIKGALNWAIGAVESFINKIISGINWFLGEINKVSEFASGITGNSVSAISTIADVSLPRLAEGGYVEANTPQIAMIGDNRHEGEIVAPESKISEAVTNGLTPIISALQNMTNALSKTNKQVQVVCPVYLDGSLLETFVTDTNELYNLRTGGYR